MQMIRHAAGDLLQGSTLENGCGIGIYAERLAALGGKVAGLEFDFERAREATDRVRHVINGAGEHLPFASLSFDLILSHEVLEHVADDRAAVVEMARVLRRGGRAIIFAPNRGYPFETHGIYWRGKYRFGNMPLVNYLPRSLRNQLVPHVRAYSRRDMLSLMAALPLRVVERKVIFGAYDNLIARYGILGRVLRAVLQGLEKTPLQAIGLSHFWVVEKI